MERMHSAAASCVRQGRGLRGWLRRGAGVGIGVLAFVTAASGQGMGTPGQFEVSPSGAATYTIPIQVPPGVAGLQPQLALSYNSQAGNGPLGVGWGLSGLSAITRCPRTLAQDGVRGSVRMDSNDRFCLDGVRLMLEGAGSGAIYGASASRYRKELDNFSLVTAHGAAGSGPAYFVVQTKAGLTLEYGNSADSKLLMPSGGAVRTWSLNRVRDLMGNEMRVGYLVAPDQAFQLPQRIDYVGAGQSDGPAVVLEYTSTRADPIVGFHAGAALRLDRLLARIRSFTADGSPAQDLRLDYTVRDGSPRPWLSAVTECDGADLCKPPTTFTYPAPRSASAMVPFKDGNHVLSVPGGWQAYLPRMADLDGDGIPDLVASHAGVAGAIVHAWKGGRDGTYTPFANGKPVISQTQLGGFNGYQVDVVDLDADGRADIVYSYAGQSGAFVYGWRGVGDGSFTPLNGGAPLMSQTAFGSFNGFRISFTDLNADGMPDLVYGFAGPSSAYAFAWLGGGPDGRFMPANDGLPVVEVTGQSFTSYEVSVADLDADGFGDIVYAYAGTAGVVVKAWRGDGDGRFAPYHGGAALVSRTDQGSFSAYRPQVLDLNGDGVADLLFSYAGPLGAYAYAWLGKGDGSFIAVKGGQPVVAETISYAGYLFNFADVNGDGIVDVLTTYAGQHGAFAYAWRGLGDGTYAPYNAGRPILEQTQLGGFGYYQAMPTDLLGRAIADLIFATGHETGLFAYAWRNPRDPSENLLASIDSAVAPSIKLGYQSLVRGSHVRDTGANAATPPRIDLHFPLYVTEKVSVESGADGFNVTAYTYGGLKAEVGTGRGLLGFRWMKARDLSTGLETYNEFAQGWPFTGMVIRSQSRLAGAGHGGLLKQTVTTPLFIATTPGPFATVFATQSRTVDSSWDLDGSVLPSITTDYTWGATGIWGDPAQIVVRTSDGASRSTVNEYSPPVTTGGSWILGRLRRATVTSTSP